MSGILTQEWREEHVKAGDHAIGEAVANIDDAESAMVWSMIAQAHYQAANVRARSLAPVWDTSIDGRPLHDSP